MEKKTIQRGAEAHGKVEMTEEGLVVPAITVIVGQACSLKCKHCANFSPFAPEPTKHYPLEQILDDLKTLFRAVHSIPKIQVQGGEPFLYKELPELLDFIRASGKATTITVATNGTIVPNETVLGSLKKNDVRVRISSYPATPKEKVELLKEKLQELDIQIWLYEFISDDSMWFDMGGVSTPPPAHEQQNDLQSRFIKCPFHDCFTLENGRVSRCGRGVIAPVVQKFTPKEFDLLPVVWAEDFPQKLREYLETPAYMEACRYCWGADGQKVPPAQQLK